MKQKHGISLIAVLMFMLAATTASIIVFRWIGQEGFASGARLKSNEAYQASQAGLEAVQGWLANRGAEAGMLIKKFEEEYKKTTKYPVRLAYSGGSEDFVNLLGEMRSNKGQNYQVYLTGVDLSGRSKNKPDKLKFISEGFARDSSKYSQVGIFDVEGLYQVQVPAINIPSDDCEDDFDKAFRGGISGNTQARWSSATIEGNLNTVGEGIRTMGNTVVTGNVTGNGFGSCGQSDNEIKTSIQIGIDTNNVYIMGNLNTTRLQVCGSIYVGGKVFGGNNDYYVGKDFYTVGGFDGQVRTSSVATNVNSSLGTINGNFTSCGDVNINNDVDPFIIKGHVVMEDYNSCACPPVGACPTANPFLRITKNSKKIILGDNQGSKLWTATDLRGNIKCADQSPIIARGGQLLIPDVNKCSPSNNSCDNNGSNCKTCQKYSNPDGLDGLNFNNHSVIASRPTCAQSAVGNKPPIADKLEKLSGKISSSTGLTSDPVRLPDDTRDEWLIKAAALLDAANQNSVTNNDNGPLPNSCIYLLKIKNLPNEQNPYCQSRQTNECQGNFVKNLNNCYADLYAKESKSDYSGTRYMYKGEGASNEFFLPVALELSNATDGGTIQGNFVWIFDLNRDYVRNSNPPTNLVTAVNTMSTSTETALKKAGTLKLPVTTGASKVFVYLPKGASKIEMSKNGTLNYFIFSEGNIDDASGSGNINGSVFLAQSLYCGKGIAKSQCKIGSLPDTKLEFNRELYQSLVQAGILKGGNEDDNCTPLNAGGFLDEYHVPFAPHLKVALQSKYKNKENIQNFVPVASAILVLPRVIYVAKDVIEDMNDLKKYYSILYMNGAPKSEPSGPTCVSLLDGTSSLKKKGLYECKLTKDGKEHFFHVVVDGKPGTQKARLSWDRDKVNPAQSCAKVYVEIDNSDGSAVTLVEVAVSGASDGWNITPQNATREIQVPLGQKAEAYQICLASGASPAPVEVRINTRVENGRQEYQLGDPYSVTISEDAEMGAIARTSHSNVTWKFCPSNIITSLSANGEWVSVSCPNRVMESMNDKWSCKVGATATWLANAPNGCEVYYNNSFQGQSYTVNIGTVQAAGHSFTASLRWKTANVPVSGGNVVLRQSVYPDIPQTVSCNGQCEVYQGVDYVVSLASGNPMKWACSKEAGDNLSGCNNTTNDALEHILVSDYETNRVSGHTLKAYGNMAINLSTVSGATLTCNLARTLIDPGPMSRSVFDISLGGYHNCPNDYGLEFSINGGTWRPIGDNVFQTTNATVRVRTTGCDNNPEGQCSGLLTVDDSRCQYQSSWCGDEYRYIRLGSTDYEQRNLQGDGPKCYFTKSIEKLGQHEGSGQIRVNGVVLPGNLEDGMDVRGKCGSSGPNQLPCNEAIAKANVPTADGGYYIYAPSGNFSDFAITGGVPESNRNCNTPKWPTEECLTKNHSAPSKTTLCGSEANYKNLITRSMTNESGQLSVETCYFASSIQNLGNGATHINGIPKSSCSGTNCTNCTSNSGASCVNNIINRVDGGYYIRVSSGNYTGFTITSGIPECGTSGNPCLAAARAELNYALCGTKYNQLRTDGLVCDQNTNAGTSTPACFFTTDVNSLRLTNEGGGKGIFINGVQVVGRRSGSQSTSAIYTGGRCGVTSGYTYSCSDNNDCPNPPINIPANHSTPNCHSNPCNTAITEAGINPIDGGYYIYVEDGWFGRFNIAGSTPPACGSIDVNATLNNIVNLSCSDMPSTGIVGAPISEPTVRCGNGFPARRVSWAGHTTSDGVAVDSDCDQRASTTTWTDPVKGVYCDVRVTAYCPPDASNGCSSNPASCKRLSTKCIGKLVVSNPTLMCENVPGAGTAGVPITPPAVSCNNNSAPTDITWNNAPNWENPTSGTYGNITATAKCNGYTGNLSANCNGTLVVSDKSTIEIGSDESVTQISRSSFNLSNGGCANVKINWDNQNWSPNVSFACTRNGLLKLKITNTTTYAGGTSIQDYDYLRHKLEPQLQSGQTYTWTVCLEEPTTGQVPCVVESW